jgi:hypothetical protein
MEKQMQPIAPGSSGQMGRVAFAQPTPRFSLDYASWHAHLAGTTGRGAPAAEVAIGQVVDFDPTSGRALTVARQSA